MVHRVLILLFPVCVFLSCSNKKADALIRVPRNTAITPANAFTDLNLDSLSVEKFINGEVKDDTVAHNIRNFYNGRNYQFAWFDEEGLTEQGEAFWSLYQTRLRKLNDSSIYNSGLQKNMEKLLNEDTTLSLKNDLENIELSLTLYFLKYLDVAFNGKIKPEEMQWHIPGRKIDPLAMLDSFLSGASGWQPLNQSFYRLQNKLIEYASYAKNNEWQKIDAKKTKFRKGNDEPLVVIIKKRLAQSGNFALQDTSSVFNDSLEVAVKKMQRSYGLKETGIIDADLIKELNVPVNDRMQQMKINLERMRWMPEEKNGRLVANIPEFKLHVYDDSGEALNMDIVVGKAANRTVIFSDELEFIVFSPYWNVPRSIVRKEIQPSISRNSNYLKRNNMEITGYSNGLPIVRQKPGGANALGRVKFIFPNQYNIYFHDTPAKTLFSRQQRAFSHGCIRLQQPFELAKYLLKNKEEWTDTRIRSAMDQTVEKWVKLERPIPVFIVYFTSWVDTNGTLYFREDIYGHDKKMKEHLFK